MKNTITITGLDGTGKSTHANWLQTQLPNSTVVSVWDIITKPEFREWSIYNYPPNVEEYIMNLDPASRSMFIFHAFNKAYQHALHSDYEYLIFDSHWYKYWAIEQAMGAPASFGQFLSTLFTHADITFCLDLPIKNVIARKSRISIYEGGNMHTGYSQGFQNIQEKAFPVLKNILPNDTIFISALHTIDDIQSKIWSRIIKNFKL
jgi:thymidylate kinase